MPIKIEKRGGSRHKPSKSHAQKQGGAEAFKSRTEAYSQWKAEGIDIRIKKSMHKDNRGRRVKEA